MLIAAHGNSLRSIIMYLDKLTSDEVGAIYHKPCQIPSVLNYKRTHNSIHPSLPFVRECTKSKLGKLSIQMKMKIYPHFNVGM